MSLSLSSHVKSSSYEEPMLFYCNSGGYLPVRKIQIVGAKLHVWIPVWFTLSVFCGNSNCRVQFTVRIVQNS